MTAEKITKWRTPDGVEHSTKEMADHWGLLQQMIEILENRTDLSEESAYDVLNAIGTSQVDRQMVRDWLDACDAMEKASLL